jgi:hypothetical protein
MVAAEFVHERGRKVEDVTARHQCRPALDSIQLSELIPVEYQDLSLRLS